MFAVAFMDRAGRSRIRGERWQTCIRAGLAAAVAVFAGAATGAGAQDTAVTPTATERFPTLDRRSQVAPSAEFDHLRAIAHGSGHVRIIVGLRVVFTPEGVLSPFAQETQHQAIATASAAVKRALSGTDHRITRAYDLVPLIALDLSEGAVIRLQKSDLAATLWIDAPRPPSIIGDDDIAAKPVAPGGAIALLDTGVDKARAGAAKVVGEACFSGSGNCPNGTVQQVGFGAGRACQYAASQCQHGTQMAAVAGRRSAGANGTGAAPVVDIVAIQVFSRFTGSACQYEAENPCALTFESDHIAGLQHAFQVRNTFKIGAASLSLGNGLLGLGCNDNPMKLAIDNLGSVGIATLVPLGNGELNDVAEASRCVSSAMTVKDASNVAGAANPNPAGTALPDLIVTDAFVVPGGGDYAVRGLTPRRFQWGHTTKNVKAPGLVTKTAPASQTGLEFVNSNTTVVLDTLHVPELGASEDNTGSATIIPGEDFTGFELGTYQNRICADAGNPPTVKERSETNNCTSISAPYYVIPYALKGVVTGTQEIDTTSSGIPGKLTLSWNGTVEFSFNHFGGPSSTYRVSIGSSINFSVSGTAILPGPKPLLCRWTGGPKTWAMLSSDDDSVLLTFGGRPRYRFLNFVKSGFQMTYFLRCPGIPAIKAPLVLGGKTWMFSGGPKPFLDPGLTNLTGTASEGTSLKSTYTWNLNALDPN